MFKTVLSMSVDVTWPPVKVTSSVAFTVRLAATGASFTAATLIVTVATLLSSRPSLTL